jgi:hypothetical protein
MKTYLLLTLSFIILSISDVKVEADFVDFSIWDCPYQCHGDADCETEMGGLCRGFQIDLNIFFMAVVGGYYPAYYPESPNYNSAVDFDRNFQIDGSDQEILETWYGASDVPDDCGKKLKLEPLSPDCLLSGTQHTIKWQWKIYTDYIPLPGPGIRDCPGTFSLYYSTDDGQNWNFIETVSQVLSYDWLVPAVDSELCLIRIDDDDHYGLTDTTALFTIHQCQGPVAGDLDNNCYTNISDFAVLGYYWFSSCAVDNNWCQGGDFDFSEALDLSDLSYFVQSWCLCGNPCDQNCL